MDETIFKYKTCIVTGGAQGIGWVVSKSLAENGAMVYICDISDEYLNNAKNELLNLKYKNNLDIAYCDVSRRNGLENWLNKIIKSRQKIDIIINNATFVKWGKITDISIEEQKHIMQVGYEGMLYTINNILPIMLAEKAGHIINISSSLIEDTSASYIATQSAIDSYTKAIQKELEGTGVFASLIRPGYVANTHFIEKCISSKKLSSLEKTLDPEYIASKIIETLENKKNIVDILA